MAQNVTMLSYKVKHTYARAGLFYSAMETMGDRIKTLRRSKGWTQQDLADRLSVTRASVSQWERSETKDIKNRTFLMLVRELGTSAEYLLFGPDNAGRDSSGKYKIR